MSTHTTETVCLTIDEQLPAAAISRIRWRVASSGPWPPENSFTPPFGRVVIDRPPLTDIEIELTWGASRQRLLRGAGPRRTGARTRGNPPLLGVPLREHWHPSTCADSSAPTTLYVVPATASPALALA
jgi:hypothetical protein